MPFYRPCDSGFEEWLCFEMACLSDGLCWGVGGVNAILGFRDGGGGRPVNVPWDRLRCTVSAKADADGAWWRASMLCVDAGGYHVCVAGCRMLEIVGFKPDDVFEIRPVWAGDADVGLEAG